MIIGIDASRSQDTIQKTGVEKVSDALLRALFKLDKEEECIFYVPKLISWLPQNRQKVINRKRFWTIIGLSLALKKSQPDVFFSPVHELPFFLPAKTFRFLHDVAFKKTPQTYNLKQRLYLNWGLKRSIKKCQKIFVSTQEVKKDLLKYTRAKDGQIVVTGLGYKKLNYKSDNKTSVKKKKQLLYIGRLEEKKNIINLIKAFELFAQKYPDYKLILVGKDGFGAAKIKSQAKSCNFAIELRGYVSEQDKQVLLKESQALIHVPFEEGFSFPLLEAFDFSLPVVAADIPVLREVGGEACRYVDQTKPDDIAQGIEDVVLNNELRQKLVDKGDKRLNNYSWERVAGQIFDIMVK